MKHQCVKVNMYTSGIRTADALRAEDLKFACLFAFVVDDDDDVI